jgi:hypothetical protein
VVITKLSLAACLNIPIFWPTCKFLKSFLFTPDSHRKFGWELSVIHKP